VPISWSVFFLFFFSFFFLYHVLLVKVQELACIVRYGVKKTLIPNNRPLHLRMGKIKHPESIGKNPPRLASKTIYLRHVRKQFIETYRRETQTLRQAPQKQKKGLIAKARQGLRGRKSDRRDERKPLNLWADIRNHKRMVAPVITSIQGVGHQAGR